MKNVYALRYALIVLSDERTANRYMFTHLLDTETKKSITYQDAVQAVAEAYLEAIKAEKGDSIEQFQNESKSFEQLQMEGIV